MRGLSGHPAGRLRRLGRRRRVGRGGGLGRLRAAGRGGPRGGRLVRGPDGVERRLLGLDLVGGPRRRLRAGVPGPDRNVVDAARPRRRSTKSGVAAGSGPAPTPTTRSRTGFVSPVQPAAARSAPAARICAVSRETIGALPGLLSCKGVWAILPAHSLKCLKCGVPANSRISGGIAMNRPQDETAFKPPVPDFDEMSRNMARFVEEAGKVTAAYIKPLEQQAGHRPRRPGRRDRQDPRAGRGRPGSSTRSGRSRRRAASAPQFLDLWASTLRRAHGEEAPPVAAPEPQDDRFKDPEWSENPVFDFLKQAYLITTRWAEEMVDEAEGLDAHTRHKARLLRPADRRRALALELRRHQSRADPRDHRGERRQPRARHEDARRGHRGRRRRAQDPPDRSDPLRGRRQHGEHARQGGLPQRADRADPVRARRPTRC